MVTIELTGVFEGGNIEAVTGAAQLVVAGCRHWRPHWTLHALQQSQTSLWCQRRGPIPLNIVKFDYKSSHLKSVELMMYHLFCRCHRCFGIFRLQWIWWPAVHSPPILPSFSAAIGCSTCHTISSLLLSWCVEAREWPTSDRRNLLRHLLWSHLACLSLCLNWKPLMDLSLSKCCTGLIPNMVSSR